MEEYGKYATGEDEVWSVSAIVPGVMGQTGMETVGGNPGVVAETKPGYPSGDRCVGSEKIQRLNQGENQIADAGINPGSGVGNHRNAITEKTVGIPVIAIGVPTVVDAATIVERYDG
ncbi:MAG: GPR endopeptidase [Coprococcus sp.]